MGADFVIKNLIIKKLRKEGMISRQKYKFSRAEGREVTSLLGNFFIGKKNISRRTINLTEVISFIVNERTFCDKTINLEEEGVVKIGLVMHEILYLVRFYHTINKNVNALLTCRNFAFP